MNCLPRTCSTLSKLPSINIYLIRDLMKNSFSEMCAWGSHQKFYPFQLLLNVKDLSPNHGHLLFQRWASDFRSRKLRHMHELLVAGHRKMKLLVRKVKWVNVLSIWKTFSFRLGSFTYTCLFLSVVFIANFFRWGFAGFAGPEKSRVPGWVLSIWTGGWSQTQDADIAPPPSVVISLDKSSLKS